jgi:DNA-binding MarR family transcriptional regulator
MSVSQHDLQTVFRLFTEIGIISQLMGAALEKVMPGGLTISQFSVLHHLVLRGEGGQSPVQIARAMQVTKGAMTNTLGHLDRAGYISVTPDAKDGRAKRVELTDAGRRARDAAIMAVAPELAAVAAAVSMTEIDKALPFLRDLRVFLDERRN